MSVDGTLHPQERESTCRLANRIRTLFRKYLAIVFWSLQDALVDSVLCAVAFSWHTYSPPIQSGLWHKEAGIRGNGGVFDVGESVTTYDHR